MSGIVAGHISQKRSLAAPGVSVNPLVARAGPSHAVSVVMLIVVPEFTANGPVGGAGPGDHRGVAGVLRDALGAGDPAQGTAPTDGSGPADTAQQTVLELMALGLIDEKIARQAGMSVSTVRRHVTAIMNRLGVLSRFAAGAAAQRKGWMGGFR